MQIKYLELIKGWGVKDPGLGGERSGAGGERSRPGGSGKNLCLIPV